MPPYSYLPLDEAKKEIRVVTLLPGEFEDAIRFTITHKPFGFARKPLSTKTITQEHRRSLSKGWFVCITLEGRFLYEYTDPSGSEQATQPVILNFRTILMMTHVSTPQAILVMKLFPTYG